MHHKVQFASAVNLVFQILINFSGVANYMRYTSHSPACFSLQKSKKQL